MRYVILRDDDTNAFTPVECLERLYRPFLERELPVNLAVIPDVSTNARMADGRPEGFLGFSAPEKPSKAQARSDRIPATVPIGANHHLVNYLRDNSGYHILQHGCHHDYLEFDQTDHDETVRRLEHGGCTLVESGLPRPQTFVAPYDKLSRAGMAEVAKRFRVFSSGWFELRRLPHKWWPRYVIKKMRKMAHWKMEGTLLLSHPGCLLSCNRAYSTMLGGITHFLDTQRITVLVTHWWEYFRNGEPDTEFIDFLHQTAIYLATHPELKVISFDDLLSHPIPLN